MGDTSPEDSTTDQSKTMDSEALQDEKSTEDKAEDPGGDVTNLTAADKETDETKQTEKAEPTDGDSETLDATNNTESSPKEKNGTEAEVETDEVPTESPAEEATLPASPDDPTQNNSTLGIDSETLDNADDANGETEENGEDGEEEGEDEVLKPIAPSPARQRAKQAEQKLRNRLTKFSSSSSIRSNGSLKEDLDSPSPSTDDELSLKLEQLSNTPDNQAISPVSEASALRTGAGTSEAFDTTPRASSVLAASPRQFSFTSMRQSSAANSVQSSTPPLTALQVKELAQSKDIPRIQTACLQLEGQIVASLAKYESDPYGPQISQETQQWMDWEIRLQNRLVDLWKQNYDHTEQEGAAQVQNTADSPSDNGDDQQSEPVQADEEGEAKTPRVTAIPSPEALDAKKELVLVHCRLASLWAWYNQNQFQDDKVAQRQSFVAADQDTIEDNEESLDYCRSKATDHLQKALVYSREVKQDSEELATTTVEPIHWQSEFKTLRLEARLRQKWREYDSSLVSLEEAQNILLDSMAAATKDTSAASQESDGLSKSRQTVNPHHVFLELCSIQVEMAGLHAKMNNIQLAIETLKETAKAIIIEQEDMENERKKHPESEAELVFLGLEFDRVTSAIYGKLGTLLIEANKPKKAAAFLAMSLELTWAIYNSPKRKQNQKDKQAGKLDDKRLRQQAERLSKQLSQAISAMKLLDNEEEVKAAVPTPETQEMSVQAEEAAPETKESGVQADPSEAPAVLERTKPFEEPPAPPVQMFPYTLPRVLCFSTRTWWMVDIQSFEDDEEETGSAMALPRQGATPLVLRCMRQHGWDSDFARRVLMSYRQFLVIKKKYEDWEGTIFSPCAAVEKMWMSHCMDMSNYYLDCMLLVGKFCHYIVDEDILQPKEKASRLEKTVLTLHREFKDRMDEELWLLDAQGIKSLVKPARNPIQKVAASMTQSTSPTKSKSPRSQGSGKKL